MKAQLRIVTGARAGHTAVFSQSHIAIGRHPASDLRFDPERDLAVSARHAAILRADDGWYVRDLGSRNGTLVNARRIAGDTRLGDADQIRLGPDGPVIEFRLVPDSMTDGVVSPVAAAGRTPPERHMSTTARIRVEVARQTRRLRGVLLLLVAAAGAAAVAFVAYSRYQADRRDREIAAMGARTDSVLRAADQTIQQLRGQVEGLADALARSQTQVGDLQVRLTAARRAGDRPEIEALERRLADVTQALQYQQAAAQVDYRSIVEVNQRAVAMIYAEFAPGEVYTGTAFAVRSDGTMLTNRHVLHGHDGRRRPSRLGAQFADSDQFFPAEVLRVSDEVDLALIRVPIRGGVPTVRALNQRPDTLRQGDPVALVGFPLGTDLPMSLSARNRPVVRTTFTAGTVSKVLEDRIQIDGYGAQGSSGSPIFDRNGEVVAILYGGQEGTGGRIVYSVPASYGIELLNSVR